MTMQNLLFTGNDGCCQHQIVHETSSLLFDEIPHLLCDVQYYALQNIIYASTLNVHNSMAWEKKGKERKGTLFKCLVDLALEH